MDSYYYLFEYDYSFFATPKADFSDCILEMRVQRNRFYSGQNEFVTFASPNLNTNYFYSMIIDELSYYKLLLWCIINAKRKPPKQELPFVMSESLKRLRPEEFV